jgi:hypothetical protein
MRVSKSLLTVAISLDPSNIFDVIPPSFRVIFLKSLAFSLIVSPLQRLSFTVDFVSILIVQCTISSRNGLWRRRIKRRKLSSTQGLSFEQRLICRSGKCTKSNVFIVKLKKFNCSSQLGRRNSVSHEGFWSATAKRAGHVVCGCGMVCWKPPVLYSSTMWMRCRQPPCDQRGRLVH